MRNEANKEVMIKMEEIKEEIIDHFDQAEERLRQQIAEGNEQIMGTLQELRKQMLPPLLATVKRHGQSPPPPSAAPQRGSCASPGRVWRLWAARCAEGEAAATGGCSHTASAARASRLQRCGCRRLCMQVKQQLLELRCAEEEGDGALLKKTASEVPRHIGEIA